MYLMSGTRLATGRGFSPCIYWSSPPIMKFNQIIKLELSTNNAIKSISNECFDNTHTCSLKAHEAKKKKKKNNKTTRELIYVISFRPRVIDNSSSL